ncbi:MAG: 2-dehydropantoate 2-reductase [Alphaproteobacteria bacterium]|nr:2-dehydropantoate 2-reductase [Alphaproteobacteria bacterium]MBU0797660.1 2-dehydropantoate 2-reductase [Alphaproteobacteria bacterium]MBU0888007.1 2-dehydropantoate 2-reductase [Alphaproteobacteria bacterium]MBU1811684.1 2-dehydropantoate 2-reductase [Alphaproteobacteria bacterium]
MKICIYGAGSVGGFLGAKLARAGEDVTLIARGAHLEAIRSNGLTLQQGEPFTVHPKATDKAEEAGVQDLVICTVKAHGVSAAAAGIAPLLGPDTTVVFALNGIPWWYFHGLPGAHEGRQLERLDPAGTIWKTIGPQRAIGCVVHIGAEVTAPGTVTVTGGEKFEIGEPDGSDSPRLAAIVDAFRRSDIKVETSNRIRDLIWSKLLGNVTSNTISALTRAKMGELYDDPILKGFMRQMMEEAEAVALKLGAEIPLSIEARFAKGPRLRDFRTSTLQDLLASRPLEVEPIIGIVTELGDMVGVETPSIDLVYALLKRLAISEGLYPA